MENTIIDTKPVEFDPFAGPEIALIAPATEPQVEIWTSCLIGGEAANCAYNECFSLLLTGVFNADAMKHALQQLVDMHEALRSAFSADGKSICVFKNQVLDIDFKDLSQVPANDQQAFVDDYNTRLVSKPFDLVNGPLFKAAIFKYSESEHLLTFVVHHIVCDGWSIGIMMQDLGKLYSAYAQNADVQLPPAPSFAQYAIKQLKYTESAENKETEQYWLDQFMGSGHLMDIPTDFPRPSLRTYKSHREDLILDGPLTTEVKKLAKANGSSFVTTLLAAFEVFMKQVTGQEEIIIGLPDRKSVV